MEIIASATDNYFSFLLSKPLSDIWKIFLLGMARVVPAIALAPFVGGKMLPDIFKMGLGLLVILIFLPMLILQYQHPIVSDISFMFLLVKETFIGSLLGFIISVPFYYIQGAGALIDHQRGSQSLQVMDPSTQMQTSPFGTLFNDMMLVIFFYIGGPILFFDGILSSYTVLPFDQFFPPQFFDSSQPLWAALIEICHTVVKISLQLSAPAVIAMLLSDLFLGIANRMAPQVQISFLLWSLKAFVGVGMVWAAWWLTLKQFDLQGLTWLKYFTNLIHSL